MIELTEQQRQSVKNGEAIRISAPEIGEELVVLAAKQYETMCEVLDDRRDQRAVLNYSMKQAMKAAKENPY